MCCLLALLEENGRTPARSKEVKANCGKVSDSVGTELLTTLKSINIIWEVSTCLVFSIENKNHGLSGGHYYEYELE